MATKHALILNGVKFLVNPTNLKINMGTLISTLTTQGGVKYYIWYDTPESLSIQGVSAGKTAYRELLFLKSNFTRNNKTSTILYKSTMYSGIITSLDVTYDARDPNQFTYNIGFQLLQGQKFKVEDFSVQAADNLLSGSNVVEDFVNVNLARAQDWISNIKL